MFSSGDNYGWHWAAAGRSSHHSSGVERGTTASSAGWTRLGYESVRMAREVTFSNPNDLAINHERAWGYSRVRLWRQEKTMVNPTPSMKSRAV